MFRSENTLFVLNCFSLTVRCLSLPVPGCRLAVARGSPGSDFSACSNLHKNDPGIGQQMLGRVSLPKSTATASALARNFAAVSRILGIESSCDDSGVAIVDSDRKIHCNRLASQFQVHSPYGGVVPNLAAREHEQNLPILLEDSMREGNLSMAGITAIAVTTGPGLTPCLRAGCEFAFQLAKKYNKEVFGVNHLVAHILVSRLFEPRLSFPFLVLLVSGGHCLLAIAHGVNDYQELGCTLDDSLGEAYDKTARLLKITRPDMSGGATLEQIAACGNPERFSFPVPMHHIASCDFSFAGLKSAVKRTAIKVSHSRCFLSFFRQTWVSFQEAARDILTESVIADIAASFQRAAVEHLKERTARALKYCSLMNIPVDHLVSNFGPL